MRRSFFAICILFGAAGDVLAVTVDLYADNRRACTGTAQVSGSDTTHLAVASFANQNATIFSANTDLQYMGIHITAGTSAPTVVTPFKITAVDNTDPVHPILTIHSSMGATPAADWTFVIFYGSNVNTGASQTKGSSTTGPVSEINYAISSSALSANDEGYIHVRGNTGQDYTNAYGSFAGFGLHYTNSFGSTKTFVIEGYVTTAIPSDLATAADKTSTYVTADFDNPDVSVNSSAGAQLYADTALTDQFPKLRFGYTNGGFVIGDPAHATPSMTLRCLDYRNASVTGSSNVIQVAPTTTSVSVTIDRCIIGSLETTDDNASAVNVSGTGVVSTANVTISKSAILGRRYGVTVVNLLGLSIDQSHVECYGKNKDGTTVNGIYAIKVENSTAAAYSAGMLPTNQCRRFTCTDNNIVHTETHSAACTTTAGIQVNKSVVMEFCNIRGNKLALYSQGSGILISGVSSFDVQHNRVEMSNATLHGVAIAVGADASVEANPTGAPLLLVASGTNDANGSQVAADGGTPLALPAHSTFKLTGGSATDDVYNGMVVYKIDTTSKVEKSVVWDYDGTTKIAKCTPQFGTTVASGVKWELYRVRQASHGVIAHNLVNSVVSPLTTSHAFGLFQGCDHVDFHDNTAIGYFDNGIVLKGEYNRVFHNRIRTGRGTLLIKGGSWNDVHHNTFVSVNAAGGGGCLVFNDKSNVHNMNSGEVPLQASHDSKTTGNRVVDNIFIVESTNNTEVIVDSGVGAGSWAGAASAYPMGQANYIDHNVYYQAHASAALASINAGTVTNASGKAGLLAAWAAYSTALQYGATNDQNSTVGTITLRSPSTGDFRVIGGSAASRLGSDGDYIGAPRSRSYLITR